MRRMGTISVSEALKSTPRPHYLCGMAEYVQENGQHRLLGKVNFSSDGHPSIEDRGTKYLKNPHVNAGDCLFAIWNAAHIIASNQGYSIRTLIDEIRIVPKALIPPDQELDLELIATEPQEKSGRNQSKYYLGRLEGRISKERKTLIEVFANYFLRK